MNRLLTYSLGAALAATVPALALADTIDQNATTDNAYMAGFVQTDLAQSFQQSASNISGASIFLHAGSGTQDTVTISLWDALPNAGGTSLASASAFGTAGSWLDVAWAPVAIAANTTYYLVFSGNTTLGIDGDITNQYSRGQVYANAGYTPFPEYDYTFRTYAAAVPEPSAVALMLGGLLLLGSLAKRRSGSR